MDYEYISWNRFYRLCGTLYRKVNESGFEPDLIIAITRGGYPAARVLADWFGLMDLVGLKIEHYRGPEKQARTTVPYPLPLRIDGRRVLMVDDVSDSGDTFEAALAHLEQYGHAADLRTAVLHHKTSSSHVPDYHAHRVVKWRWITYPWALVEDMSALAEKITSKPRDENLLLRSLPAAFVRNIPKGVLEQVTPVVLDRLGDTSE